jgi:ferredoxin
MVRRGFAEERSVEQLLAVIDKARDLRLTHITDNIRHKPSFICNCCSCCCELLGGVMRGFPNGIAKSNYTLSINQEPALAAACAKRPATCWPLRRCRRKTASRKKRMQVRPENCLGCGACVSACPTHSLSLVPAVRPTVPEKKQDLFVKILKEKKRFTPFLVSHKKRRCDEFCTLVSYRVFEEISRSSTYIQASGEDTMTERTYSAGQPYTFPLIIKKLLSSAMVNASDQEIVYRGEQRYTYRDLNERIHRLAGGLSKLGVKPGEVVAVFDYDSPRYLECFFAIPMMGSVLQTVNWRLSTDQIVYTINHAEASVIVINSDFLPLLEAIKPALTTVRKFVVIVEGGGQMQTSLGLDGEYESMLRDAPSCYDFPDLDENTKATTFYTTGTTGDPKGVYFSHRQLVLHTMSLAIAAGSYDNAGRFLQTMSTCR